MREDFLHYVWKHNLLDFKDMKTTKDKSIQLIDSGSHNFGEGPDFFNSKLRIDDQLWAGNVEIHINSSDWYAHQHQYDDNYDSVILHVVWNCDIDIFRQDGTSIDTLELESIVGEEVLFNYNSLFDKGVSKWINCENQLKYVSIISVEKLLKRMYLERLSAKSNMISELLSNSLNNWEKHRHSLLESLS